MNNQINYQFPESACEEERFAKGFRIIAQLIGTALLIGLVIAAILLISAIKVPAKAEESNDFPSYWEWDSDLVKIVQEGLNLNGAKLKVDGKFGPKTGTAVKNFQIRNNMKATGVVDDETAAALGLESWPYEKGYTLYYMANLADIYAKGDYEYLVYVALGGRSYDPTHPETSGSHFALFRDGELVAESLCITGDNKTVNSVTLLGPRKIKAGGWIYEAEGKYSRWYNITDIGNLQYIHSLLEYKVSRDEQQLGLHLSDGSIRIPKDLAEWVFENLPAGTIIVVDDRSYQPYSIGYEDLIEDDDYADWEEVYG